MSETSTQPLHEEIGRLRFRVERAEGAVERVLAACNKGRAMIEADGRIAPPVVCVPVADVRAAIRGAA